MSKQTIAFHTLGCKLNFSETSSISQKFDQTEFDLVSFHDRADVYVINSCSVTQNAEKKCKQLAKQARKINPDAHIAIIGCFSQLDPGALQELPGVSIVLGNSDKYRLFEYVKNLENPTAAPKHIAVAEPEGFVSGFSTEGRTRSFFKIQDGCDYFCSYCTIPLARGRSRSNTIEQTLRTASQIAETGMKEVVLTGVNIGDFGKQHNESFYEFLKELIKVQGLERIRISSVEPDLLHPDIIDLVAQSPVLMPHFHIPLQSGSDRVLKAMGRRYDTALFASRVEYIKSKIPHACIAADVIVGFPEESPELFQETMDFLSLKEVSYVHVFTYSERGNTRAVKYEKQIDKGERNKRSKLLQKLSNEKKQQFYQSHIGHQSHVLWEKENINGRMFGFTENYIKVKTAYNESKANTIEFVTLKEIDADGVFLIENS